MAIIDLLETRQRIALVGINSQGKSYALDLLARNNRVKNCSIYVTTEVKSDENLKNSTDSSTLISWLNRLLNMTDIKNKIDEEILRFDLCPINDGNISISLKNDFSSYKGIIGVDVTTTSNTFFKPGSGEKFLGQLILISKILEDNTDDYYKYLIIDEPERHLHHSLYIKMGTVLNQISRNNIKVVISTHSPIILKYFVEDTNEIIRMENGDYYELPNINTLINLRNEFNVYTEPQFKFGNYIRIEEYIDVYFGRFVLDEIYRCLFSKITILAEGYAEKEILSIFSEKYKDWNNLGVIENYVLYGKCFFPWIISILHQCNIKTLCIYDKDSDTPLHDNINNLIDNNSDSSIKVVNRIEERFNLSRRSDKVKETVINLRIKYINNDETMINFLSEIKNKLEGIL